MNQTILIIGSTVVAFVMATLMIFVRAKAAKKPMTPKKIILPPLMMSTGAWMFLFPAFRVSWLTMLEAMIVGILFSIILIKQTRFEIRNNDIYVIPSKSFIFILFGLLIVRIIIKLIIGSVISLGETSGVFFLLALAMIFTWRLSMLRKYYQLRKTLKRM